MKSIEESLPSCIKKLQTVQDKNSHWQVTSIFCFPPTFPAFGGHFPGIPILPGIVQLSSVRYIAEQTLEKTLLPSNYNKIKFRAMIKPDQEVHINLEMNAKDSQYHGKFQIRDTDNDVIASGHCVFTEKLNS